MQNIHTKCVDFTLKYVFKKRKQKWFQLLLPVRLPQNWVWLSHLSLDSLNNVTFPVAASQSNSALHSWAACSKNSDGNDIFPKSMKNIKIWTNNLFTNPMLLSFLKKSSVLLSYRSSWHFFFNNKSFFVATIKANTESWVFSVIFLSQLLICCNAENAHLTFSVQDTTKTQFLSSDSCALWSSHQTGWKCWRCQKCAGRLRSRNLIIWLVKTKVSLSFCFNIQLPSLFEGLEAGCSSLTLATVGQNMIG